MSRQNRFQVRANRALQAKHTMSLRQREQSIRVLQLAILAGRLEKKLDRLLERTAGMVVARGPVLIDTRHHNEVFGRGLGK